MDNPTHNVVNQTDAKFAFTLLNVLWSDFCLLVGGGKHFYSSE